MFLNETYIFRDFRVGQGVSIAPNGTTYIILELPKSPEIVRFEMNPTFSNIFVSGWG